MLQIERVARENRGVLPPGLKFSPGLCMRCNIMTQPFFYLNPLKHKKFSSFRGIYIIIKQKTYKVNIDSSVNEDEVHTELKLQNYSRC